MAKKPLDQTPDPTPLYVCLALAIGICAYFFFVGFTAVRLWFYKGALGPAPEKFIIVPLHRRKKASAPAHASTTGVDVHNNRATFFPHITEADKRKTVMPHIAEAQVEDPFSDEHAVPSSQPYFTTIPRIHVEDVGEVDEGDVGGYAEYEDPDQVRRYIAEERRISRLPAFDQDDCGDGHEFPSVPYATEAVVEQHTRGMDATRTYVEFRLRKEDRKDRWLTIDHSYKEMLAAREKILDKKQPECVQVKPEGEAACEELLKMVVQQLGVIYDDKFALVKKNGRRHIRCLANFRDYCIQRPFEYHPLELSARLAGEDFSVFVKGPFTHKWYL
jgi:hypothetical protein